MTEIAATTRGADAFDFLFGSWEIANRRLRRPLSKDTEWEAFPSASTCSPLLRGTANIEEVVFRTKGFTGIALRLFDAERDEWTIHWADTYGGGLHAPVVGRFVDGRGEFIGSEVHEGAVVPCRLVWSDITPDSARWEQAFQAADGSWETNWEMDFSRAGG